MAIGYVLFDLADGFIDHWLVAGPQVIRLPEHELPVDAPSRQAIARRYYATESLVTGLPVERGPLSEGVFRVGDYEAAWSYVRCREDHLVDHTALSRAGHYLRSWAYAQLVSDAPQTVTLRLATCGPADLWLNGEHTFRHEGFADSNPCCHAIEVQLREGANELLVRFEQVATAGSCHAMALQVRQQPEGPGLSLRLPTTIPDVDKRRRIERVLEAACIDRDVYGSDDVIAVRWPEDLTYAADATVRLQAGSGRIYAEAHLRASGGECARLRHGHEIPAGPYRLILMPRPDEYYEQDMRIRRELRLWVAGNSPYSEVPYGTFGERRQEALVAATRCRGELYAEIARMALGQWTDVDAGAILAAIARVDREEDGAADLVALVGMQHRFGRHSDFPASLRQPLEACILGYPYPASSSEGGDCQALLGAAAAVFAGQLYPEHTFRRAGVSGHELRERAERVVLRCLRQRGSGGLPKWGSPSSLARDLVALSHLVDLAETDEVYDMATAVLDKTLLALALSSFKGTFGAPHADARVPEVFGGLLGPVGAVSRLLWGQGIYNQDLAAAVSLACLQEYELPPIITEIATHPLEEEWGYERHLAVCEGAGPEVNKAVYRTPDTLLASAQDYRPGQPGSAEHIWQATLGPAAVVFTNHPACSDDVARRPGFWAGNRVLPRVAQWKDMLIAIYNLPEDDWMGFTHAYFPTYAFDEHLLHGGWAFARRGDGYLALTASQGLSLVADGHSAMRELRSAGRHNVWLCHLGRAALDGSFERFQERVLGLKVTFEGLEVRCTTLRGDSLSFGWQGPFLRNGEPQPLSGYRHYENPYMAVEMGAEEMEVRSGRYLLRLRFGSLPEGS
jgi:hypothetical protein